MSKQQKTKEKADTRRRGRTPIAPGRATAASNQKPWNEPRFFGKRPRSWYYVNPSGSVDVVAGGATRISRLTFAELGQMFSQAMVRRAIRKAAR